MNKLGRMRTKVAWLAVMVAATVAALLLTLAPQRLEVPATPSLAPRPVSAELVSPFDTGSPVIGHQAPPAEASPVALPALLGVPPSTSLPSLSYNELQALKESLAEGPDPDGEFASIAAFMIFGDAVQRLRQLNGEGGDPAEMQALARLINDSLPQRLGRHEISASDAQRVKALVLDVLEPDPLRRQTALARWQEQSAPTTAAAASASAPR